jgi:murein DD-endopeptidase MepM/ murein hydrolase activator NlpD
MRQANQVRFGQWPWRSRFIGPPLWPSIWAAGLTLMLIGLALPARAWSVQVTPSQPQLGDTLAVVVKAAGSAPTVTYRQKTYAMYALSGNRYRALLPTTPLDRPGKLTLQVNADKTTQTLTVNLRHRTFPTQSIWLPPGQSGDVSDFEYDRVDAFKQIISPQKFWDGKLRRPNNGPITTIYGVRRYYNGEFAKDYFHRGVDYAGNVGSAVIAPAAGQVRLVGREKDGFTVHGNCVGIDHGQGVASIFLHLSRIDVKDGDRVQAGQVIGALGGTGAATGPHLHWGFYVQGLSVDPAPWREQGFD